MEVRSRTPTRTPAFAPVLNIWKDCGDDREVWMEGKRVADVTTEPGIKNGAQTLASFLDRQHEDQYRDTVTYVDEDGDRCAKAYQKPKSVEDVRARGACLLPVGEMVQRHVWPHAGLQERIRDGFCVRH